MATVFTCFRKLKFWMWLFWNVLYLTQTGFLRICLIKLFKRSAKKFSFTLISINRTKYNIFLKSGYFVKISKTGIRLIHQNFPFLDGKVLPNSVLSMNKFHACALEYGHNSCNFCKFILWYSNLYYFLEVTVLCSYLWTYQFMHINKFTLWSQSMKCLRCFGFR